MIKVGYNDKEQIVNILTASFDDNKSVNYIVKQDSKRKQRIRLLMEYSFDVCFHFGKIFLSGDTKACALILLPDKKKITFRSAWSDIKLIFGCIGISNVSKAMNREAKIKALQPKEPIYYLWFIGVSPEAQGKGIGSKLLKEVISDSGFEKRIICLETSTTKNIPWYQKFGFTTYNKLNLGYELFFLKKE